MSALMVIGSVSEVSPMPEPIPEAVVKSIVGDQPKLLLMVATIGTHFAYGGTWGALLTVVTRPITLAKGLAYGVFLWVVMGTLVLPFVGWGLFGRKITPRIAIATLILHLIYGGTLGMTVARKDSAITVSKPPVERRG